jgi:hypothetical protein
MGTRKSISQRVGDVVKSSFFSGIVTLSNSIDDSQKVAICGLREIRMVEGHMQIEHEKHVACWLSFPLQGVHQFKSPQLSNISNHLSCGCHQVVN